MVCYLRLLWISFVRDIQGTSACIKGIGVWIRPRRKTLVVLFMRRSETYQDLEPVSQVELQPELQPDAELQPYAVFT